MTTNLCPCCDKHCDLSNPRCGRGRRFLETGVIPEKHGEKKEKFSKRFADESYRDSVISERLFLNLRNTGHVLHFLSEGKGGQKRALIILNKHEKMTQRELTEKLRIQPGSVSELLSKLEEKNWIVRTQNEEDRRNVDIVLTDEGKEQAVVALEERNQLHEDMFTSLSMEEKEQLLGLLEKLNTDFDAKYREKHHKHHHNK